MKEKILFIASVERHLSHFHTPFIRYLQSQGYEVHTASNGENQIEGIDRHYDIGFARSPYSRENIKAYRDLKKIIDENGYKLIHTHTPAASVIARLASRSARKRGMKVAYTAHGFHFYEGAPALNNIIFKNVEKLCSKYTDFLLTMNKEDYSALFKYKFKHGRSFLTKGMGVDCSKFHPVSEEEKLSARKELDIPEDAFVLVFPAEYSERKYQSTLIAAMAELVKLHPDILLLLPGEGPMREKYEEAISVLNLGGNVRLLGYRRDMDRILAASDVNVPTSKNEGLPINVLESLAMGIPCVASDIRGHTDLITDGFNGFLVPVADSSAIGARILRLYEDRDLYKVMGENARESALDYDLKNTLEEHSEIYEEILK